jgi:hypothetical protein
MSEIIDIQNARYSRRASERFPKTIGANADGTSFGVAIQRAILKDDIQRAILLLDIAAQQARMLVREIDDPSRRENFEAQLATIEQLLQIARDMASKL